MSESMENLCDNFIEVLRALLKDISTLNGNPGTALWSKLFTLICNPMNLCRKLFSLNLLPSLIQQKIAFCLFYSPTWKTWTEIKESTCDLDEERTGNPFDDQIEVTVERWASYRWLEEVLEGKRHLAQWLILVSMEMVVLKNQQQRLWYLLQNPNLQRLTWNMDSSFA